MPGGRFPADHCRKRRETAALFVLLRETFLNALRRFLPLVLALFVPVGACWAALDGGEARVPWDQWIREFRSEALGAGISPATVDVALRDIQPIPRVIELDRSQPEFTLTAEEYLSRIVSESRIEEGREKFAQHRNLLKSVGGRFGVQPRFLVALWGIETNFGRTLGTFKVVDALATLAYDGRRSAYFRRELLDALRVMDAGKVSPELMWGSWAGAMGNFQFMPSSLMRNWVDFNGDGRLDVWEDFAEALASGANYLAKSGWRDDQTWGRKVKIPKDLPRALLGLKTQKKLSEWQRLGVRRANGRDLPARELEASLISAQGDDGPYYLVYGNFRALLTWNRSNLFAIAVGQLSDELRDLE